MKRFAYFIEEHEVIECLELTFGNVRSDLRLLNQLSREYFGEGIQELAMGSSETQHFVANNFGRIVVAHQHMEDDVVVGLIPSPPPRIPLSRIENRG